MKIIIIGAGAGGASVATRLRRLDEHSQILLLDKSNFMSQATCGIPYFVGNVINDRDRMVVAEPEVFESIFNIDVRNNSEVLFIHTKEKKLIIQDHVNRKIYTESYDKLVLSPGSTAVRPTIPGIYQDHVHYLNNLNNMDGVTQYLNHNSCTNAIVIGGGFVGVEIAENLYKIGLNVSIIESGKQVLSAVDIEMAEIIQNHLISKNITLFLNQSVESISRTNIQLANKKSIISDLVIVVIGMRPNIELASKCGLKLGTLGGICVNENLLTSDSHIYALGDAVEILISNSDKKTLVQLAGPTHKQADVVSENINSNNGMYKKYKFTQTASIVKVFDYTVAVCGLSEKQLKNGNINYQKSYTEVPAHASYYPKSFPLNIKLMFCPDTGVVLGAQIIGINGVDKRIDIISTIMQFNKSIFDMAGLNLAYSPPYSSAKDPINIAGMVAINVMKEKYKVTFWDELKDLLNSGSLIIDVRTFEEYELNSIEGSVNIPIESLRDKMNLIPKNKNIIFVCQQGKKSYFACRILRQYGYFNISSLNGGLKLYCPNVTILSNKISMQNVTEKTTSNITRINNRNLSLNNKMIHSLDDFVEIDASGLCCPGPILKLSKKIKQIKDGSKIKIIASDRSFESDVVSWCNKTGNVLICCESVAGVITAVIQKAQVLKTLDAINISVANQNSNSLNIDLRSR